MSNPDLTNINDKGRMSDPVQEETAQSQLTEIEVLQWMLEVIKTLSYNVSRPMYVDWQTGRMKVQVESWSWASINLNANQTLATLTTLVTLSNLQGGITTTDQAYAINRMSWQQNVGSKL